MTGWFIAVACLFIVYLICALHRDQRKAEEELAIRDRIWLDAVILDRLRLTPQSFHSGKESPKEAFLYFFQRGYITLKELELLQQHVGRDAPPDWNERIRSVLWRVNHNRARVDLVLDRELGGAVLELEKMQLGLGPLVKSGEIAKPSEDESSLQAS